VAADYGDGRRRIESQRLQRGELVHRGGRQGAIVERRAQRDAPAGYALGRADVEQLHALSLVEATRQVGGGDARDGRVRPGESVSWTWWENATPARGGRTPVFRAHEYIVNAFTSTISSIVPEGARDAVHPAHHARRVHGRRLRRREEVGGVSGRGRDTDAGRHAGRGGHRRTGGRRGRSEDDRQRPVPGRVRSQQADDQGRHDRSPPPCIGPAA